MREFYSENLESNGFGQRQAVAESWRDLALCTQTDPEIFYPDRGGSTRMAKQVCSACEVREECLEDALATKDRFGIRGGLSERERRKLKAAGNSQANS